MNDFVKGIQFFVMAIGIIYGGLFNASYLIAAIVITIFLHILLEIFK